MVEDDAARLRRADAGRMAPRRGWWRREDEQGMAAQLHSGSTAQRRFWSAGRREVEVRAREVRLHPKPAGWRDIAQSAEAFGSGWWRRS